MRFPSILDIDDYRTLLTGAGLRVEVSEDTGRFAPYVELYRDMVTMQLTYDALKAAGFDYERMNALEAEREFIRQLAREARLIQAILRGPQELAPPRPRESRSNVSAT